MTIKVTNARIAELEKQLADERLKELTLQRQEVWSHVRDLDDDDLTLLSHMINEHFHGDGEDD